MNIIGCLDKPTSGQYLLEGTDVGRLNDNRLAELRNKKLGFVFQQYNLLPRINALSNVELPLIYCGILQNTSGPGRPRAGGAGKEDQSQADGNVRGEQQQVAIARALINNPSSSWRIEPTRQPGYLRFKRHHGYFPQAA